jgi:hypothetical protein
MNLDFREREWGTADGRSIKIKDMDLGHLVNVLNWVHDHDRYSDDTRARFIAEAEYRKTFLFAEGKPYATKIDGRWKVIDPETGAGTIIPPPADYVEAVKENEIYQRMSARVQEQRRKMVVDK